MIPIIKWEIAQRKMHLFWWCVGTVILIATLLLLYPSIQDQAKQLNTVLNQLPAALRTLKTGGTNVDITSNVGYLHSQLYYITLPLILIIFTVNLGRSLISQDEQNHTLEVLLARPISRSRLLAAKGISGLIMATIVGAVSAAATVILANAVGMEVPSKYILLTTLWTMLLITSFGVISFALSTASQKTRHLALPVSLIMSFGGYLIASLSGLTHWLVNPAKIMPYHYFDPRQILVGNVSKGLQIYILGIFVVGGMLSWLGFRSRDLD